ncbi:ABC transporter ATP-binding protein [Microbacterium sp. PMIC_1C1B]|uniref:ABC transporter ATP-binding protein n=2 Tax=Microbacterium memoriense TaxID=2978350 RepID=A0ABT2PEZ9_9MICO|nr:ABC transporter ATP-binding protein [Microbacterium memoriense]MCT9002797.1 ABC transporter ATP-binding protein [Microbacterium memoriense]
MNVGNPVVVRVSDLSKRFTVRKDSSIKERIVTLGRAGRKHRQDFWALRDVSLDIRAGETIGLIGHNGSGKSTLLKMMGGIIDPTSGTVERRGRLAALLELGAGFHPDLTGRENVYLNASVLGLSREETDEKFADIVQFSGIADFIDTQVKFYSSGMYVRLAFAVAVHTDPDILLVDEVLAVGDEAFQRKCLDKIRTFQEEGRTIIIVSHSLGQITELCDRAVLLNKGEIVHDGAPMEAVAKFRDILEGRRVEADGPVAEDAPEGAVLATTVRVEGRNEGEDVEWGDDVIVTVVVESDRALEDWIVAIQVDNTMGQKVLGTDTRRLGTHLPALDGRVEVAFSLERTTFGTGKYFINTSLMDARSRHLHDQNQAASFNAAPYELTTGMLRTGARAEVTVLDGSA